MTMKITGNTEIDAILNGTLNPPMTKDESLNKLLEIYKEDEKTVSEFLDNHDLPRAVKMALLLNLRDILKFIEFLESMETKND